VKKTRTADDLHDALPDYSDLEKTLEPFMDPKPVRKITTTGTWTKQVAARKPRSAKCISKTVSPHIF
jgi:hypothetical protein